MSSSIGDQTTDLGTSGFFSDLWEWIFGRKERPVMSPVVKDQQYWENKYPKVDQKYQGRPIPGTKQEIDWDVREFVWDNDLVMQEVVKNNNLRSDDIDQSVWNCQKYVVRNLTYVGDNTIGIPEFWLLPGETANRKRGDCEDGALLIASLAIHCLPPEERWRIRVACGFVQENSTAPMGGHAYCVYMRKKDGEAVAIDWCYYEDSGVPVDRKPPISSVPCYKDVWFSFNHQYAWSHTNFALRGRIRRE